MWAYARARASGLACIGLLRRSAPSTHAGRCMGNTIADGAGVAMTLRASRALPDLDEDGRTTRMELLVGAP